MNLINNGFFYAFLTSILFSSLGLISRFVYGYNLSPNVTYFYSSSISTFAIFIFLYFKNKNFSFLKIEKKDIFYPAFYGALFCLLLPNVFSLQSLNHIDSNISRVLINTNPLFIIIMYKIIFKQKLDKSSLITLAFVLLGFFLTIGNATSIGKHNYIGILYALLSSLFVAIYAVISERNRSNLDDYVYCFYAFLFSSFYSIIYILISGSSIYIDTNYNLILLLFIMALVNFAIPYIFFIKSILMIGADKCNLVVTSSVAFTMIISVTLLNEKITFLQLIGALLILFASIIPVYNKIIENK